MTWQELDVQYLDVDARMAHHAGRFSPWMGLFHVEIPASKFSAFLQKPISILIPALENALKNAGGTLPVGVTWENVAQRMRMHLWSGIPLTAEQRRLAGMSDTSSLGDLQGVEECVEAGGTICYLVAASCQPVMCGPLWCKPPDDPDPG